MVLVVHDLEMRGSKLHLIHNYKDVGGGGLGRKHTLRTGKKYSECESNKTLSKPLALKDALNVALKKKENQGALQEDWGLSCSITKQACPLYLHGVGLGSCC